MTLSEIRQSNLSEAEKKMYFYDRMLSLICLKRHNLDRYSELLPHYLYWKQQATGSLKQLRPESVAYVTRVVIGWHMRLRYTDLIAFAAKVHDTVS